MLLLKNCRLVEALVEGYADEYCDLLIEDKKIKGILPLNSHLEGAFEIDVQMATVLPGFFDLHAHLMFKHQDYSALLVRNQNETLVDGISYAKAYLKHGFTTIRDCGNQYNIGVAIRDAIDSGVIQGPRVITSGKILTPTAKGNKSFGILYREIDKPEDALGACRVQMSQGVDFIKYMITGAVLNEGGDPGALISTSEEIVAMSRAADSLGTYVAAHCHGKQGIMLAVLGGIKTIEHASYLDQECIELIHKHGNGTAIVPTLSIAHSILYDPLHSVQAEFSQKAEFAYQAIKKSLRGAVDNEIAVGFGTDIDYETFVKNPGLEFLARTKAKLSEIQVLKQATIESAKILNLENELGTVKEGKTADLIVVQGKPDQDIACLAKKPVFVIKSGKIINNDSF